MKSLARGLTVGTIVAGTTTIICAERKETPNRLSPSAKHQSAVMFLVRTYAIWNRSKAALIIIVVNFTVRIQNREASCCDLLCLPSKAFFVPIVVILVFFNSAVTGKLLGSLKDT
jgi:hypothetical protein